MKIDWTALGQGFKNAVTDALAFRAAHATLVNYFFCLLAGFVLGYCAGS